MFDPLPCWRHLSAEEVRRRVARRRFPNETPGTSICRRLGSPALIVWSRLCLDRVIDRIYAERIRPLVHHLW